MYCRILDNGNYVSAPKYRDRFAALADALNLPSDLVVTFVNKSHDKKYSWQHPTEIIIPHYLFEKSMSTAEEQDAFMARTLSLYSSADHSRAQKDPYLQSALSLMVLSFAHGVVSSQNDSVLAAFGISILSIVYCIDKHKKSFTKTADIIESDRFALEVTKNPDALIKSLHAQYAFFAEGDIEEERLDIIKKLSIEMGLTEPSKLLAAPVAEVAGLENSESRQSGGLSP